MRLAVLGIIFLFTIHSYAKEDCVSCGTGVRGLPDSINEADDFASKLDRQKDLSNKICVTLKGSRTPKEFLERMRQDLLDFHEKFKIPLAKDKNAQNIQFTKLLDENKEHIKCKMPDGSKLNYLAYSLDTIFFIHLFQNFLYVDLKNDQEIVIDPNIIVTINKNGQEVKGTILDLVELKLSNATVPAIKGRLKATKKLLINKFRAKYYDELSNKEKETLLARR